MSRIHILILALALCAACSGSGGPLPVSPTAPTATNPPVLPTPAGPPTVTITAAGMSPLEITITVGQRVTFVNNDTRPHDVIGGIDPANPECPEILVAGFLTPGQSRETGVFTQARTCDYHDHTALGVPAFSGRIIIR